MSTQAVPLARHEQDEASAKTPPTNAERAERLAPALAAVMALVPILVAPIRAYRGGWMPYGDDAYFSLRAWDVFSRDIPLLGTSSSGTGRVTKDAINHPGPLQFDLLAVPVRLLGHDLGTAVGQALINAAAIAVVAWLVNRLLGRTGATLAIAACALLVWSMGSEVLYRPWGPFAVVLPFVLFLVAVWCSLAGDRVALPVAAVAGSYCLQTHLSYALLVPGLALLTAGWTILQLVRATDTAPHAGPRRHATVRWAGLALIAGAACWIQPVVQQLAEGRGNLTSLVRSAGGGDSAPGLGLSIRRLAQTVALPPAWLPPTFSSPPLSIEPPPAMGTAGPALALLIAATAILAWRAKRRGSDAIAAAGMTSLVAIALGLATLLRLPMFAGIPIHQVLWLWPLGLFAWLVVAAAVVDELAARSIRPRLLVGGACTVAVIAGFAALPTRAGFYEPFAWARGGVRAVDDDVVDAVRGKGPILVEMPYSDSTPLIGPAMLPVLQREGIPFLVRDDTLVQQVGERRRFHPGEAAWQLTFMGGLDPEPPAPQHRLIVQWSSLSPEQSSEFDRLTRELHSALVDTGLPLVPGGADRLRDAGFDDMLALIEDARSDPDAVLEGGLFPFLEAWFPAISPGPVIDADRFPVESIPRWVELALRHHHISIFLGPVEDT
jgi:hypothetical protein